MELDCLKHSIFNAFSTAFVYHAPARRFCSNRPPISAIVRHLFKLRGRNNRFLMHHGLDCLKHSSILCRIKKTLLHGLFSVVRAEVLRLLFTNRGEELYTRELARLSFLALRTVQDELAKLEAAQLIVSRSNGYQRFYRANPQHPLYAALAEVVRKGAAHAKPDARLLQRVRSKARKNRAAN